MNIFICVLKRLIVTGASLPTADVQTFYPYINQIQHIWYILRTADVITILIRIRNRPHRC